MLTRLFQFALTLWMSGMAMTACSQESASADAHSGTAAPAAAEIEPMSKMAPSSGEVLVFGSPDESRAWLESENWWGSDWQVEDQQVPRLLITGVSERWARNAQEMTVAQKKEVFYRFMLPLVMHANSLVEARRAELREARAVVEAGGQLDDELRQRLANGLVLCRVASPDQVQDLVAPGRDLLPLIDELQYRLDIVPPGLALGQAAYESGWGTSRFAHQGNALFGQWTYGGDGIPPKGQRSELGDHRIAAFEWPFDSVRGYFINLASHPAYEDFRRLRAEWRKSGEPLDSLRLADGLIRYSERGQDYVDSLKSLIRYNRFDTADSATSRDEPLRFYMAVESPEDAERVRAELDRMREAGELREIYERMNLE